MKRRKIASVVIALGVILSQLSFPVFADDVNLCGDTAEKRVYNYCPSAIAQNDSVYVFYCRNDQENYVNDNIYLDVVNIDRQSGDKILVLSPSDNDQWDSNNVCDPSVITGDYQYNGKTYHCLMAYLGCSRTDNQHNQIGLAVSESLDGEWIKTDEINPIITADFDPDLESIFQWGAGQPSLLSLDDNGTVAVFYTRNDNYATYTMCEVYDFSNLNAIKKITEFKLSNAGTADGNNNPEILSNTDFAYEPASQTLYMITDQHPFGGDLLSIIPDNSDIYSTYCDLSAIAELSSCVWTKVDTLSVEKTGSQKNHNAGFIRDGNGRLLANAVLYTSAKEMNTLYDSLWTYRIGIVPFKTNEPVPPVPLSSKPNTKLIPPAADTVPDTTQDTVSDTAQDTVSDTVPNTGVDNSIFTPLIIGSAAVIIAVMSVITAAKRKE